MKPNNPNNLTTPRRRRRAHAPGDELDHFVKALSHDMNANFMLLESSFKQVKKSCGRQPIKELAAGLAHVEACLQESKRFLDDLVALGATGSVRMEPRRVRMQSLVEQVVFEQEELLIQRGIRVDVVGTLPDVWCHQGRVKQVVTNLVRNAAKHGCSVQRPEITVSHGDTPASDGSGLRQPLHGRQWFRIHDNGPGIPPEDSEAIFLPGRRLSTAADGSGMGLAIVRKIVEFFGGQVFVDQQCRQGTAVLFSLPALPADQRVQ